RIPRAADPRVAHAHRVAQEDEPRVDQLLDGDADLVERLAIEDLLLAPAIAVLPDDVDAAQGRLRGVGAAVDEARVDEPRRLAEARERRMRPRDVARGPRREGLDEVARLVSAVVAVRHALRLCIRDAAATQLSMAASCGCAGPRATRATLARSSTPETITRRH